MAVLHHAFLFSPADFLERITACRTDGAMDAGKLHAAATAATALPSADQRDLLELIRFEPEWWLARGADEEPFRWVTLVLSGVPSLRPAPSLSGAHPSGFTLLREALAVSGWDRGDIELAIRGRPLDTLVAAAGLPVGEGLARGMQLMPGHLAPSDAEALLRRLAVSRQDRDSMARARQAVTAYCRGHALVPAVSAEGVMDGCGLMLRAAADSHDHLLLGVFD